jgi:hypothetical protein
MTITHDEETKNNKNYSQVSNFKVTDDIRWWEKNASATSLITENDIRETILNKRGNRQFDTGSQRDDDTNKPLPSHLDAYVRMRYGYLLRQGANHYEKGNWRKGQPIEAALESLHRHLAKFEINLYNGVEQDEDHLSAIIFNVQLIMKNEEKEGISVDKYYKKV